MMERMCVEVSYATEPGDPAVPNEDFVAATPAVAVVLDGVTPMDRSDTGCVHGVAWYARTLGAHLFRLAGGEGPDGREVPLADCLAGAIGLTRDTHAGSCDLAHPDSPAATVGAVRLHGGRLDYLVLSDAAVLLDTGTDAGSDVRALTDHRAGEVGRRLRAEGLRPTAPVVRSHRNRPGGYWVAAERPEAAYEALVGTLPVAEVRRVAVATDGATRLVDTFHLVDWRGALDALEQDGPPAWIARTREVERAEAARAEAAADRAEPGAAPPPPPRGGKVHDDATVALLRLHGAASG